MDHHCYTEVRRDILALAMYEATGYMQTTCIRRSQTGAETQLERLLSSSACSARAPAQLERLLSLSAMPRVKTVAERYPLQASLCTSCNIARQSLFSSAHEFCAPRRPARTWTPKTAAPIQKECAICGSGDRPQRLHRPSWC